MADRDREAAMAFFATIPTGLYDDDDIDGLTALLAAERAATRNDRAARIETAARDVLDLYEQDKIDSLGFCERRRAAMKALADALESP